MDLDDALRTALLDGSTASVILEPIGGADPMTIAPSLAHLADALNRLRDIDKN